uniref:(northern house mosquito) hypothetical protein n=1 Tax=Culex pipiens TaxID=7175 RepID=A0A8D8LEI5_CULPI
MRLVELRAERDERVVRGGAVSGAGGRSGGGARREGDGHATDCDVGGADHPQSGLSDDQGVASADRARMAAGRLSVLDAAQTLVLHAAQPAPKVLECHLSALSGLRVPAVSPVSVQLRVRLALPADAVRAQLQQPVRHVPGGL